MEACKGRVLILDDEPEISRVLADSLTRAGFVTVHCAGPRKALDSLVELRPDVIVTDAYMPEMSGLEFLKAIRQRSQVPVIFMSGQSTTDDIQRALQAGASLFVSKPFSLRQMVEFCIYACQKQTASP